MGGNFTRRRLIFALLAGSICLPIAAAQRRGSTVRTFSAARPGTHRARRFSADDFLGSPFFYPDYDYREPNPPEPGPAPLMIMQPDNSPRKAKASPLLIEWQGDRYVRYGGIEEDRAQRHADYAESTSAKSPANPPPPASPAVLVYRDGHRQEISSYSIADGVIYPQGSDWQSGSKPNPIPLSALDPLATMQANQQRGVNFMLPSASNVVIASF